MIEKQMERHVKRLHNDTGLEFCSNNYNNFYKTKGILRHLIMRHTQREWYGREDK